MIEESGRVLAVDPGEKRLGIAVSDPTGTIANPVTVLAHVSRVVNAASIVQLARDYGAVLIVIGQALDWDGEATPSSRRAVRLAEAMREQTEIPVMLWDESGSTREARSARFAMGVNRRKRQGHLDEIAATVILQSFLDARSQSGNSTLEQGR